MLPRNDRECSQDSLVMKDVSLTGGGRSRDMLVTPSRAALEAQTFPQLGLTELEIFTQAAHIQQGSLPCPVSSAINSADPSEPLSSQHQTTNRIQLSVMVSGREPVAALEGHDLKFCPRRPGTNSR